MCLTQKGPGGGNLAREWMWREPGVVGSPRFPAHRRGQLRLRTCTVDPGRGPAKLQAAEGFCLNSSTL